MTLQTLDQVLPLLELIQQPAFCLNMQGQVISNRPASVLAPASEGALTQWLGSAAALYSDWNRTSDLVLPLSLGAETVSATIRPLADGTLFLLSPCPALSGENELAVTAQVLRQPLHDLFYLMQQLGEDLEEMEDPYLQGQTASLSRQLYRLNRIANDMADLDQLRQGSYPIKLEKVDLRTSFLRLETELTDLCKAAGYELICRLPDRPLYVLADWMLLERALLNLLSNAMKYGSKSAPLEIIVTSTATAVHLKVRNLCEKGSNDLLTSAFQRLTNRNALPDPRWGIGLGLPLALAIARTMGGTMAVDVAPNGWATVSMSMTRMHTKDLVVKAPLPYDYTGGMRRTLVELSDCLPDICFDSTVI